jgi:hypothetical protein
LHGCSQYKAVFGAIASSTTGARLTPLARGYDYDRETTNLVWEHMRAEILQRQLELLRLAAELDLHHDGRVQRHGDIGRRRHGAVRLIGVIGWGRERAASASSSPQWSTKGAAAGGDLVLRVDVDAEMWERTTR